MDIGKSLSYYFEDPRWVNKLLIGTVIFILSSLLSSILVGILGYFILAGYALETLRNVRNGERYPMPEWSDRWGEWLVLGIKQAVAVLVWALPAILLSFAIVAPALLTGSGDEFWTTIGGLGIACLSCLIILWGIVVLLASPAIYIHVAETESLGAGVRFGDILAFTRDHIGDVIIVSIVYMLAAFVVGLLGWVIGLVLCGVGVLLTVPAASYITMLIQAHLYGQIGRPAGSMALVPAEEAVTSPTPADTVVDVPVVSEEQ